jgi:hypothetical protein
MFDLYDRLSAVTDEAVDHLIGYASSILVPLAAIKNIKLVL